MQFLYDMTDSQVERGKVALISGGGSGHEPFCAGYIGETAMYQCKKIKTLADLRFNLGNEKKGYF